jgi:hypothetical protein
MFWRSTFDTAAQYLRLLNVFYTLFVITLVFFVGPSDSITVAMNCDAARYELLFCIDSNTFSLGTYASLLEALKSSGGLWQHFVS